MFSSKIIFFLVTSTFFLQYTNQANQIRGTPEVDYPTYYVIPKTSFRCSDQLYNPGFYADVETRCQVFHYCYEYRQESFLCPMGTIFNQPILACDYWYSSNCSLAPSYYRVNADKRNEEHFDEDDPLDLPSENVFDKMAHLYEINNKQPESTVLKNDSDVPEIELLDRDGVESSEEPLIEKNNKTDDYNKYSYENRFNMADEKHREVVKYEIRGLNTLNMPKGSNEELYETDNMKDFIFSEDGMLHQSQDDVYQLYPTDMNFNQESSGFAEIPREGNFEYDLNDDLDPENDVQISDFEFEKRYADMNGVYVRRRPSNRKPVIVIPEAEPEIVPLPVLKRKRKPIGIASTVSTNANIESSYKTNYDSNIFKEDTVSIANEGLESVTSDESSLDEQSSDLNGYDLRDPKLFYESEEEINDENGSQLHQTDSLSVVYDYSNQEKTGNAPVLSDIDEGEISYGVFESGSNDFLSVSNVEDQSTLIDSSYGDESKMFIGNAEISTLHPGKTSETTAEDKSSFDNDLFLGSESEENMNQSPSSDGYGFPEDQYIFSDSENTEITVTETSYDLPMNVLDTFEGSGISEQEKAGVPKFTDEVNEPIQFFLKEDSEGSVQYGQEPSFPPKTFGQILPLENLEDNEGEEFVLDGSGGSNEFSYLPHEFQESRLQDTSDKMVPEIQEIDGSYYVFSDSEHNPNHEYDDSSGFYSENADYVVTESFEDVSDKTTEELIDNEGSLYVQTDSKIKMDDLSDDTLHTLDYQDSRHEKPTDEFEAETLTEIPEEYITEHPENIGELSTEDLKFLEIMSENPPPMLQNLFEVSNEKSSSDSSKEVPRIEIVSPEQDVDEQAATHEDPSGMEAVDEFDSLASNISSDIKENSTRIETSKNKIEIVDAKQIAEEVTNIVGLGQDGSEISSTEQNFESFVLGKEADPFSPQFVESDKIVLEPKQNSKQKSSLKVPVKPKISLGTPAIEKDPKKDARGKRFNENFPTINPPNKGKPLIVPSTETFRETMFTNIPSSFLKMKHSAWRPYFLNHGLKSSGFNPRTGDSFQSSKLSKLTSWGNRLLAAKSSKFNRVKKYIDSYRN